MRRDERTDPIARRIGVAMTACATLAIEQALIQPGQSRWLAVASTLAVFVLPLVLGCVWLDRRATIGRPLLVLGLAWSLPLVITYVQAMVSGRLPTPEVLLMSGLRNLGIGLTWLASRPTYARLAALVGLFVVTVAPPVGGESGLAVLLPAGVFGLLGVAWLSRAYRASTPGRAALRRSSWGSRLAFGTVLLAAVGLVSLATSGRAAGLLAELVPTSGGTGENDPEARSGVGDGDNEVAASEDPQSVGFTESELYLETDRPSLYDSFNESYGEPFKPKTQERMIALAPNSNVQERDERPKENLQAGREFSAVRKPPQPKALKPSQRDAKALVYVSGPTPLHLPLTAFHHFDGVTWREEPCCEQSLGAEQESSSAWFRLPWAEAEHLAGVASHQIKVGLLDSSPLPLPALATRFKVGGVNQRDFFSWAQFGIIRMTDRTVPAGTVIHAETRTIDPERLEKVGYSPQRSFSRDHHVHFGKEYSIAPEVAALARSWVAGVPEGWASVRAIVDRLRCEYVHDRLATVPEGTSDAVGHFLLHSRRGPDYLFAGAAAVLLRSLGYPVRVVSGLYASPDRYDSWTRHTPILSEDVHFWIEVKVPGGLWITAEPTPGYDVLPPVRTWPELAWRGLVALARWARGHWLGLTLMGAAIGSLVASRRAIFDAIATAWLRHFAPGDPRRRVLKTLRLLERRASWAGRRRPSYETPLGWTASIASSSGDGARDVLEGLARWADWAVHAPATSRSGGRAAREIPLLCDAALATWTRKRFL